MRHSFTGPQSRCWQGQARSLAAPGARAPTSEPQCGFLRLFRPLGSSVRRRALTTRSVLSVNASAVYSSSVLYGRCPELTAPTDQELPTSSPAAPGRPIPSWHL